MIEEAKASLLQLINSETTVALQNIEQIVESDVKIGCQSNEKSTFSTEEETLPKTILVSDDHDCIPLSTTDDLGNLFN